jgi:hypothetical protein
VARPVITAPGLVPDMDEDWYHADPVQGGSLSVSGAKLLLPPNCPAIYKHRREHPKHTRSMDLGTVVHGMILGTGQPVQVIDADSYRTKAAQQARDAATAEGFVPMLAAEHDRAAVIAQAVRDHDIAGGLFAEGDAEQSMFWPDEEFGIWLRGRIDWLTHFDGVPTIADLKTSADASPQEFARSAAKFGYWMQDPWYRDGLGRLLGCDPDEIDFIFAVVQTDPDKPHLVMTYRLTPEHADLGRETGRIAREMYRDCTASGNWPAWSESIEDLPLPGWAVRDIERGINEWHD